MEGISDIKIIGIDEKRPPIIRKEPYIDLKFKLSHKAPADWCREFNSLMSKHSTAPKIIEKEGLFIDAWVKSPGEIADFLELLKKAVTKSTQVYIERIEKSSRDSANASMLEVGDEGEQGKLNQIIASLNYD